MCDRCRWGWDIGDPNVSLGGVDITEVDSDFVEDGIEGYEVDDEDEEWLVMFGV